MSRRSNAKCSLHPALCTAPSKSNVWGLMATGSSDVTGDAPSDHNLASDSGGDSLVPVSIAALKVTILSRSRSPILQPSPNDLPPSMNNTETLFPSFRTLYWQDFTIRRAFNGMIGGLILAAGIWWMIQPVPNALPQPEPPPEVVYGPWVCVGGIVFSVLAGIVLIRRFLLVKEILSHGIAVKGTVEDVDVYVATHRETGSSTTTTTRSYHVTFRYEVQGFEQKLRVKLFHSPGTYGLKKEGEVDLIVLESAPHKPLIRAVYLGRAGIV